jgi:hypothetical protein
MPPPHTFSQINKASNIPHRKIGVNLVSLSPPPSPWTLFLPPSSLNQSPAPPHQQHPWERNSDGGNAEFGHRVQRCPSTQQIDHCRHPQMPSAPPMFRLPSSVTKLPEDINRSIWRTYCVGTAGDGPYSAAGIVACNRIVIVNASCTKQSN